MNQPEKLSDVKGRIEIDRGTLDALHKLTAGDPGNKPRIHIAGFG